MKLIIDIPDRIYKINQNRTLNITDAGILEKAVRNSTPLDDVKAEIEEEMCLTDNPYTRETKYTIERLKLLSILDNIDKESEEKPNETDN